MLFDNQLKLIVLTLTVLTHTAAYAEQTSKEELNERFVQVEKLIIEAREHTGLWRDTVDIFNTAKQRRSENNFGEANELLSTAEFQARQGIQQAQSQQDITTLVPAYLQP